MREIPWPDAPLPAGAFAKISDVLKDGKRIVLTAIEPNEPVLGQIFETFVVNEVLKQMTWSETIVRAFHWRDRNGDKVRNSVASFDPQRDVATERGIFWYANHDLIDSGTTRTI